MKQFLIAGKITLLLTLLTGLMYPLLVTGLAKALFRDKADGSLVQANGRTVGSELIGQRFTKPEYFHGRPSAAGNDGYDGLSSGGSNLAPPPSPKAVDARVARVAAARGIPADALRQLVAANTEDRQLGVLGEPRVNVLKLNLALDASAPLKKWIAPIRAATVRE